MQNYPRLLTQVSAHSKRIEATVAKSIYERMKDVESWIPQLDAAQTENAQDLLAMVARLALAHNELIRRICFVTHEPVNKFDDLFVNINEAIERPE